jgi:membrane-bound lytic murein transglycosylase D
MHKLKLYISIYLPVWFLSACTSLQQTGTPEDAVADTDPSAYQHIDEAHSRSAQHLQEQIDQQLSSEALPDIWSRIRMGFSLPETEQDQKLIDQHLRWYSNNQQHIDNFTERSQLYIHYVVQELEARDMPTELALLPIIESSYNPFAHSSARAAGIWQFVPRTARNFGLKQDDWYDGRRDLVASTDAALRYLQRLHDMFDGDWLLAIAAYNAGEGRLMRAIEKNKAQGKPTDFWSLNLPKETRAYVPRLLALSRVIAEPELYDLSLAPIPNEPFFTQIQVDGQINLAEAAQRAEINPDLLQQLNAGYSRWLTTHHSDHQVLVPLSHVENFSQQLDQLPRIPEVQEYRVAKGDTLGAIARRFNTSVEKLKQLNHLSSDRLSIGQRLLVSGTPTHLVATHLPSAEERMRSYGLKQSAGTSRYTVRKGDSLWKIANQHKITVADLTRLNNLNSRSTLRPGQTLIVGKAPPPVVRSAEDPNRVEYQIQRGDTLHRIAQRFKVTTADIMQWNRIKDATYIHPGQTLTLFVKP